MRTRNETSHRRVRRTAAIASGVVAMIGLNTEATAPAHPPIVSSRVAVPQTNQECVSLTDFRLMGGSKLGGENAINAAECFEVVSPNTYRLIGKVAHNEGFVIKCKTVKPTSFEVETDSGQYGTVGLDGTAFQQVAKSEFYQIPVCASLQNVLSPYGPTAIPADFLQQAAA